ncbi:hypothetical protein [Nonomuraea sp. KM90]|uniref:hypothetical protein n=1 Tax=Nonomuraea sp. KM90 TaxID=3457428 RepID=UPI003FCCDED5
MTAKYDAAALNQAWLASPSDVGAEIPQPPEDTNCDHLIDWIRTANLVDRGSSQVTVTLRAKRDTTITVQAIRFSVVSQRQPRDDVPILACVPFDPYKKESFDGTFLPHPDRGSAPNTFGDFVLDVKTSFEVGTAFDLEVGQIEEAYLTGFALSCDCEWKVEVGLEVDGRTQTVTVGDRERPFRTIALPKRKLTAPGDKVWCLVRGRTQLIAPDPRRCAAPTKQEQPIY